mmetsp:Transcript_38051/g.107485  ORF Transcript_38051/g.107485 Transcript_38051/m.107485 type:complete len:250 (+) Transcript_38051:311-1060(+)
MLLLTAHHSCSCSSCLGKGCRWRCAVPQCLTVCTHWSPWAGRVVCAIGCSLGEKVAVLHTCDVEVFAAAPSQTVAVTQAVVQLAGSLDTVKGHPAVPAKAGDVLIQDLLLLIAVGKVGARHQPLAVLQRPRVLHFLHHIVEVAHFKSIAIRESGSRGPSAAELVEPVEFRVHLLLAEPDTPRMPPPSAREVLVIQQLFAAREQLTFAVQLIECPGLALPVVCAALPAVLRTSTHSPLCPESTGQGRQQQ